MGTRALVSHTETRSPPPCTLCAVRTRAKPHAKMNRSQEALSRTLYNSVFRRGPTYFTFILAGAIAGELVWGKGLDAVFNSMNSGKFFADIKIPEPSADDDDDE